MSPTRAGHLQPDEGDARAHAPTASAPCLGGRGHGLGWRRAHPRPARRPPPRRSRGRRTGAWSRGSAEAEGSAAARRAREAVADGSVFISADAVVAADRRWCGGASGWGGLFAANRAPPRRFEATGGGRGGPELAVALAIAPRATRGRRRRRATKRTGSAPEHLPPPPKPNPEEENQRKTTRRRKKTQEETLEDDSRLRLRRFDLVLSPESFPDQDAFWRGPRRRCGGRREPRRAGAERARDALARPRAAPVKAVFPAGGVVRKIAVDGTLAPPRRGKGGRPRGLPFPPPPPNSSSETESESPPASRRVFISKEDLRNKKMSRRAGTLTIFLMDASGSMAARNRMAAAKAAALALVDASRVRRDGVALVSARGDEAEVLLPPSRSLDLARKRLAELPCGDPSRAASSSPRACASTRRRSRARGRRAAYPAAGGGGRRGWYASRRRANVGLERSLQDPAAAFPRTSTCPQAALGAEGDRDGRARGARGWRSWPTRSRGSRRGDAEAGGGFGGEGSLTRSIARAAGDVLPHAHRPGPARGEREARGGHRKGRGEEGSGEPAGRGRARARGGG